MTSWRDRLRPASFRGVPFKVDDVEKEFGRRTETFEYPDRELPYNEDNGRRARRWPLTAYVIGPDYDKARDAFDLALERPGAGTLVHPYYGTLRVVVGGPIRARQSSREGGVCTYQIEFVEAGANVAPGVTDDTVALSNSAADTVSLNAETKIQLQLSTAGPMFLTTNASSVVGQGLDAIQGAANSLKNAGDALQQVAAKIQSIRSTVMTLVQAPGALAAGILDVLSAVRSLAATPEDALGALEGIFGLGGSVPNVPRSGPGAIGATPARQQEQANRDAIVALVTQAAAAEAVRAVAAMTFDSFQQAVAVRDDLADRLDDLALAAADAGDDDAYLALVDLRVAMIKDITARGGSLEPLFSFTPKVTQPAVVIAYRVYADATRADEICARNGVVHPGFVPGGVALELLAPEATS